MEQQAVTHKDMEQFSLKKVRYWKRPYSQLLWFPGEFGNCVWGTDLHGWSLVCNKCPANPFHRKGCWAHAGNTQRWLVKIWDGNVKASLWQWAQIKSKSKSWFLNSLHIEFFRKKEIAKQSYIYLSRGKIRSERNGSSVWDFPPFNLCSRELDSEDPTSWLPKLKVILARRFHRKMLFRRKIFPSTFISPGSRDSFNF